MRVSGVVLIGARVSGIGAAGGRSIEGLPVAVVRPGIHVVVQRKNRVRAAVNEGLRVGFGVVIFRRLQLVGLGGGLELLIGSVFRRIGLRVGGRDCRARLNAGGAHRADSLSSAANAEDVAQYARAGSFPNQHVCESLERNRKNCLVVGDAALGDAARNHLNGAHPEPPRQPQHEPVVVRHARE